MKKINLDQMRNISLDDMVTLYRNGYRLEDHTSILPLSRFSNIRTLQGSAVDPIVNFGKVIVSTGYSATDTSIVLNTGNGARLPDPSISGAFNLVWWDFTDYPDPSDDPNKEIVRCTARSTDTLTVTRAQESTSASAKNTTGKTYKMVLTLTAKTLSDLQIDAQNRVNTHAALISSIHNFDSSGNAPPQTHGKAKHDPTTIDGGASLPLLQMPLHGISYHTGMIGSWSQIDKTTSSIADIATRSHASLTDGIITGTTNSHGMIDSHISSNTNVHLVGSGNYVAVATGSQYTAVNKAGDTMSGTLNLPANGLVVGTNQLIVSGGNIGIGNASPSMLLDISGSSIYPITRVANSDASAYSSSNLLSGGRTFRVANTNASANFVSLEFQTRSSSFSSIGSVDNGNNTNSIVFGTGAPSERMRIDGSGNVGIGISTISTKLDVRSDIIGSIGWGSTSTLKGELTWGTVPDRVIIRAKASHDLSLGANDQFDQLYIKSGGNVGIGTASPSQLLSMYGTSNPTAYIQAGDSTGCNMEFWAANRGYVTTRIRGSEGGAVGRGITFFYNRDDLGSLNANMVIDGQYGNVGIGITSPIQKLDVKGGINVDNGDGYGRLWSNTTNGLVLISNQSTGGMLFYTGGSSTGHERLSILSNGSVGIGTTSPAGLLEVKTGSDTYSYITSTGNNNAATIWLRTGDGTNSGRYAYTLLESLETSPQRWDVGMVGSKDFSIINRTTALTNMTISSSTGYIGIGTSPSFKLDLATGLGSTSGTMANFTDSYNNRGIQLGISSGTASIRSYAQSNNSDTNMIICPTGGNIGIGITTPIAKLDVFGSLKVGIGTYSPIQSNVVHVQAGNYGSANLGQVNLVGGVGDNNNNCGHYIYSQKTAGGGGGSPILAIGELKWTGAAFTNDVVRMYIDASGNVGIGTSSPSQKLHVTPGSSSTTMLRGLYLENYATAGVGGGVDIHGAMGINQDIGTIRFQGSTTGPTRVELTCSPNEGVAGKSFCIDVNGNVGIGTFTQTHKLQLGVDDAAKPSTNTWTIVSDERIKKDIRPFRDGLSVIEYINPVWFKHNGKGGIEFDGKDHVGVIAQDIIKVAPYTVNTCMAKLNKDDENETELLNFNSHALTFVLINAVKEMKKEIDSLKEIIILKNN